MNLKKATILLAVLLVAAVVVGTQYNKTQWSFPTLSGYGTWKSTSHTFVARTDTALFPFTVSPKWDRGTDTIAVYAALRTNKNGADSINVLWLYQYNFRSASAPYAEWLSQTVAADSAIAASSTWTSKVILLGPRSYAQGYPPYQRFVAIGQSPSGGKANEIGNTAAVDVFRE